MNPNGDFLASPNVKTDVAEEHNQLTRYQSSRRENKCTCKDEFDPFRHRVSTQFSADEGGRTSCTKKLQLRLSCMYVNRYGHEDFYKHCCIQFVICRSAVNLK